MKRIDAKVYLTLFVISFLAEVYFVSQTDHDLLSILGTGVVVLVSMYMAVDSFQNHFEMSYGKLNGKALDKRKQAKASKNPSDKDQEIPENENAAFEEGSEELEEKFERLENVNKAVYVSLKKSISQMAGEFEKIQKSLQLIEEIHNDSTEETIGYSKQILEMNQKLYENQTKIYQELSKNQEEE